MHVNWLDKNILYFLDYSIEPSTSMMARLAILTHGTSGDKLFWVSLEFHFLTKELREVVFFSFQVTLFLGGLSLHLNHLIA